MHRRGEKGLSERHPGSVWVGGLRGAVLVQREAPPGRGAASAQGGAGLSAPQGQLAVGVQGPGCRAEEGGGPGPERAASRAQVGGPRTLWKCSDLSPTARGDVQAFLAELID